MQVAEDEDRTMTEINPNLKPVQPLKASNEPAQNPTSPTDVKISQQQMDERSLANMPQAAIGQSQVHFAGNINADVQQFMNNPELCQQAMEIGEMAEARYEAEGDTEAALKALNVEKAFADEFAK
ncbi:MAG: hypothetical protein NC390_06200 [Fusobacterium sp.]|nr:hypothetical protein [Fusobacterium sp.]